MAKLFVKPTCGLTTTVQAQATDTQQVTLEIESECAAIRKIAAEITEVDPFQETSRKGEGPRLLKAGFKHCGHTSCPVPSSIIKIVEVAAGIDLPKEIIIELSND